MTSKNKKSPQHNLWEGDFGNEYVQRNTFTHKSLDAYYKREFGVTRTVMNEEFLGSLKKDIRILEIGPNYGLQLELLQRAGFTNLYGLELNKHAIEVAHKKVHGVSIINGDGLDIPFKDGFFDLVFTSGVLIHIGPQNRKKVMSEIYRVSKSYIWGFEYFSDRAEEIVYRGHKNVLWKAPFAEIYMKAFPKLRSVKEQKYVYKETGNTDSMFLLKKGRA